MYSEASLLHAMPPSPALRRPTSVPISSVMISTMALASSIKPSRRRPKALDARCIGAFPVWFGGRSLRLGEELPKLRPVLRALLDDAGPGGLVGLGEVGVALRALELDHLDAGLLLLLDLLGVFLVLDGRPVGFDHGRRVGEHLALRVVELGPGVLVDEDRHLGAVEARVDAVFGLLVPAEVE